MEEQGEAVGLIAVAAYVAVEGQREAEADPGEHEAAR